MAYGSWEAVIDAYQMYLTTPRRVEETRFAHLIYQHIIGIQPLIPLIKDRPTLRDLIPGTSHTTLFLRIPGKQTEIRVWYENGAYEIYNYDPAIPNDELADYCDDREKADLASAVAVLEARIERVRNNAEYP